MKKILIHSLSHDQGQLFDPNVRDSCNDPYIHLRKELEKRGYLLDTSDNHSLEDCEWVIFFEIISTYQGVKGKARQIKRKLQKKSSRNLYQEILSSGMQNKMALLLLEGKAVCPENWNLQWHSQFPVIFTWHDNVINEKNYYKVPCVPQPSNYPTPPSISFDQKKLLVNISMNKSSSSLKELYTARKRSIHYFEQHQSKNFDLYGIGWNQPTSKLQKIFPTLIPQYSSYQGTVKHKWDVLPHYRFSLCYENIQGESGYITEKIFDSMRCNCVPIYWGAPNIQDYVDENAFIDRRNFKSDAELEKFITSMTEYEYQGYIKAIKNFLTSERFAQFLAPAWANKILQVLKIK